MSNDFGTKNNSQEENENSAQPRAIENKNDQSQNLAADRPALPQTERKKTVEDIFSETDDLSAPISVEKPTVFQPRDSAKPPAKADRTLDDDSARRRKLLPIFMLVGFMVLAGGGFFLYRFFINNIAQNISSRDNLPLVGSNNQADDSAGPPVNPEPKKIPSTRGVEPAQERDSDSDGLTDEEEKRIGTNINNVDTDNDGLYDREEVKVYKTNPLNSDTDNDGFSDGTEVGQGYNPRGDGRLYEVEKIVN